MYSRAISQRLLYTLFVLQCLYTAAQIAVFTLVALVAVRLAGTEQYAGLPSSALTWGQALSALPIAMVMGRLGRRPGLTLAYAAGSLGGLIGIMAIVSEVFPLLLVSAVLIGVGRAGSDQSRFAAGELYPEAERAPMIGRLVFAGTIGAVAGPVLVTPSGQIMNWLGLHPDIGPWAVMFVLSGCTALIAIFLLRPDPMIIANTFAEEHEPLKSAALKSPTRPLRNLMALPHVQLAVVSSLVFQTVMVMLMSMTPLHMDHHHHARDSISLVISMHTLGMFGLSPLTGYLIDRHGRVPMLMFGALTLIAATLITPLSNQQMILIVGLFLLGLGWNFGYVAATSLLSDTLQGEERTKIQGINDSLVFLGAGLGSLSAGPLFATGGFGAVSMAGLVMTFALIGLILWTVTTSAKRVRNRNP